MAKQVLFHPGIPNYETPTLYRTHEVFVNLSPSGMYDKTIIEAAACGTLALASSTDWAQTAGPEFSFDGSATGLADKLAALLALTDTDKKRLCARARTAAEQESLENLSVRLAAALR